MSKTRIIAESAIIASLYAVIVWLTPSISFQTNFISFPIRLSMGLYPLSTKRKHLITAFGLGVLLSNITSSLGAWDFIYMPIATILIGYLAQYLSIPFTGLRKYMIVGLVYSLGIGVAVTIMLYILFKLNMIIIFISGAIPGTIITLIFAPIMKKVDEITRP